MFTNVNDAFTWCSGMNTYLFHILISILILFNLIYKSDHNCYSKIFIYCVSCILLEAFNAFLLGSKNCYYIYYMGIYFVISLCSYALTKQEAYFINKKELKNSIVAISIVILIGYGWHFYSLF